MADGYLETHYAEYEKRKAAWLRKRSRLLSRKCCMPSDPGCLSTGKPVSSVPVRPDDEAL